MAAVIPLSALPRPGRTVGSWAVMYKAGARMSVSDRAVDFQLSMMVPKRIVYDVYPHADQAAEKVVRQAKAPVPQICNCLICRGGAGGSAANRSSQPLFPQPVTHDDAVTEPRT